MQPKIKSHIEFCQEVANGATYKDAYKLYVASKNNISDKATEVGGSKLASRYAEHIQILKKRASAAIDKAAEKEAVKEAVKGLLTVSQVDAKLCALINKGEICAIDIYYKRFGSYAAVKMENDVRVLRPLFGDKDELLNDNNG